MARLGRLLVHAVALTGLAAVALALGRWLRDPEAGASLIGLLLLIAVCALALRRLYGPKGLVALPSRAQGAAPAADAVPTLPAPELPQDEPALWAPTPEPAPDPEDGRIDVNTASAAELQTLPGIGARLAARIEANRPYASLDDLTKLQGVSPALVEELEDRLRV